MKLKIFLCFTIFFAYTNTAQAGQQITKTAELANTYIEYIEAELRGVFPGYQKPTSFRKPGSIQKFLEKQIKQFYVPKPWHMAPKKRRTPKSKAMPAQWKSTNEYIQEVLIPGLKAVFGDKNMKKRVRFFRETEHVGKYVKSLINRFYTKKKR